MGFGEISDNELAKVCTIEKCASVAGKNSLEESAGDVKKKKSRGTISTAKLFDIRVCWSLL